MKIEGWLFASGFFFFSLAAVIYGVGSANGSKVYSGSLIEIQTQFDTVIGQNNYEIGQLFSGDGNFAGLASCHIKIIVHALGQMWLGLRLW